MTDAGPGKERRAVEDRSALRRVIGVEPDLFGQEHWDRLPLLSPGLDTAGYADLFGLADADELLSVRGLRTPFLRLAKDGSVVPANRFTASGGVGAMVSDQVDPGAVARWLAEGTTLVLQALHRTWPPLVDFTAALADDLGHPVQVNGYLTPPSAQGFSAHYDTHDVFVVQVAGRKRWTIHAPVIERPWPDEPSDARREEIATAAAGTPYLDVELAPGDALYLPRGWLHSARAGSEATLHLTFGVHPVTVRDVLATALEDAVRDERSRQSLPLGLRAGDPASHGSAAKSTAQVLSDLAVDDELTERAVRGRLARDRRPEVVRPLAQTALAAGLTAGTRLRRRRGLAVEVETRRGSPTLVVADRRLALPNGFDPTVAARVLDGSAVSATDLSETVEETAALELLRLLVREAVLVPAD